MNRQYALDLLTVETKRIRELRESVSSLLTKLEDNCPVCIESDRLAFILDVGSCLVCHEVGAEKRCRRFIDARRHLIRELDQFNAILNSLSDDIDFYTGRDDEKAQEKHVDNYTEGERTQ